MLTVGHVQPAIMLGITNAEVHDFTFATVNWDLTACRIRSFLSFVDQRVCKAGFVSQHCDQAILTGEALKTSD
jgi:hypothetical protein